MAITYSNGTTWTYTGTIIDATGREDRPKEAPKSLLATRAVQVKDGWLGQILMAGEIVHETKPQETDDEALEEVGNLILKRFRKLIVGA